MRRILATGGGEVVLLCGDSKSLQTLPYTLSMWQGGTHQ